MGTTDMARQRVNVERMRMLGATVEGVSEGAGTLKEATSEAIRHWVRHVKTDHYVIGSAVGPHPYPLVVKTFQSVIGREAKAQLLAREGRLPDGVIACVGGGSNAIGIFSAFVDDPSVKLYGAEAGGVGNATGQHAATLSQGTSGVLHGAHSGLLADGEGRILPTMSISAGLDYPGVGPEHAHLSHTGRAVYRAISDADAMDALLTLTRREGILPALESAHAVALAKQVAQEHGDSLLLVNVSGRGDKDLTTILARLADAGGTR
jgi:tryptophan synthase beta chain